MSVTISEIAVSLRNGKSVRQSSEAGGLPITRIETIADWKIDPERVGFADLSEDDCDGWLLQKGDILISHINSTKHLGKCAIYEGYPEKLVHGMNLLGLRVDKQLANPWYIYRVLSSPQFKTQIPKITKDSVNQSSFNISNFKKLQIPLPPLEQQKRIADILDAADALRVKRRQVLEQLDELVQSVFLEMFGDPVTNPKGWEITTLSELGELNRGVSKHRPRNDPILLGGEYPLIQTGDVARSDGYITSFSSTYSLTGLEQSKMWPAGTLCITIAANIASTGILTFDACFPDSVVGFTSPETGRAEFVQGLFWFLKEILERRAPQVAQKNINLKILRELPVPAPPCELQNRFAEIVSAIEAQKVRVREHLAELDALFASLQQQAFSGEL